MRCDKKSLLLYAVTDRSWVGKLTLYEQVELALRGGATCVQLREKELDEDAFLEEAIAIGKLCRAYRVPFLIDDDVEVAVQSGADGIHVGQRDMSAGDVRKRIGGGMILGVSAQTVAQAVQAEKDGADYLGVGAVFATSTKLDAETVSLETLKAICSAVFIPVVAIGGIGRQNILRLAGTGVDGVALVSAVFGSPDIEAECRALRALSEKMVSA
jgi:thiamine-phosphate pyrophosphorylase